MKNSTLILSILALVLALCLTADSANASHHGKHLLRGSAPMAGAGEPIAQPSSDPDVQKCLQFAALSIFHMSDPVNASRAQLEVVRATRQIVAGIKYELAVRVTRAADDQTALFDAVVFVGLDGVMSLESLRKVRDFAPPQPPTDGGRTPHDPRDPAVRQLVQDTLPAILTALSMDASSASEYAVTEVVSCDTQVVSGLELYVTLKLSSVSESSSSSSPLVVSATIFLPPGCQLSTGSVDSSQARVVSARVLSLGGWSPVDPTTQVVRDSAALVLTSLSESGNQNCTLSRVLHAETQVVAGIKMRITLEVRSPAGDAFAVVQAVVFTDLSGTRSVQDLQVLQQWQQSAMGSWRPAGDQQMDQVKYALSVATQGLARAGVLRGDSQADDVQLLSAETQLVAGLNIRLHLSVQGLGYTVTVFHSLQDEWAVTSIQRSTA